MGFDKLLAPLAGGTVLEQTVLRFLETPDCEEIIIVTPAERFASLPERITSQETVQQVEGGAERHHSVQAGLKALAESSTYVAIHDGARPLVTPEAVSLCYEKAQDSGAASLARPVTETLKRATTGAQVSESISRENLWFMETPQIFSTALIKEAYEAVEKRAELVTDEVSALQLINQVTSLVTSPCVNIKITYPSDLTLAEKLLSLP